MLKATMVGGAINIPPPSAAGGAAPADAQKMAFAQTAPAQAAFQLPTTATTPRADPTPTGSSKYLPGDPMAPSPAQSRPHGPRGSTIVVDKSKTLLYVGLGVFGMLLIGAAGIGMAVYLKLVSFGK
jgi:hypothetical protein